MARLGVVGWPVAHSRSPAMHAAALAAVGLGDWTYQLLPVPAEALAETLRALPAVGFVGVNVTIPHKQAALGLADRATATARAIGAANTLTFIDGEIEADNTDAPGLLAALALEPRGLRTLVLGAGGSARAVVWALLQAGAADVQIWNRSPARADALAAQLGGRAVRAPEPAELLVNCTAVGLAEHSASFERELPLTADSLGSYRCVVDLVYRDGGTALVTAARARGVPAVDGLEVLVHQGALSFERWTGRQAPLEAMRTGAQESQR